MGGLDDSTCFDVVERYDPESNSWDMVQTMIMPRGGVAVAPLKVYGRQITKPYLIMLFLKTPHFVLRSYAKQKLSTFIIRYYAAKCAPKRTVVHWISV